MRTTSVRAPADGGSLSSLTVQGPAGAPLSRRTPGGGCHGTYQEGRQHHDARRREQPHRARAAGEGRMGPGEGREDPEESRGGPGSAGRDEAKVAEEQAAALARASHED